MPSFSSGQFRKEWRYSVAKDFHSMNASDPTPVQFAPNAPQTWGSEAVKLPVGPESGSLALNCDESLLAVGVGREIHVYSTDSWTEQQVLKGHAVMVENTAFHPSQPGLLLSSAAWRGREHEKKGPPEIILWDLDAEVVGGKFLDEGVLRSVCEHAVKGIERDLGIVGRGDVIGSEGEREEVSQVLGRLLGGLEVKHHGEGLKTLAGTMLGANQGSPFDGFGKRFLFVPGERPTSNGRDDRWVVGVWDVEAWEEAFTLVGHTDVVTWACFSPDGKTVGTVSWDQSFRLWDAVDGRERFVFKTEQQNWTGAFSPDSKRFTATCGDSTFYIYDVENGAMLAKHGFGGPWCRTLDWSGDMKYLAVGGGEFGKVVVLDVERDEIVQERKMNGEKSACKEEERRMIGGFIETSTVRFMAGEGLRLACLTGNEGALEVIDFDRNLKWRFAAPDGEETGRAFGMVVFRKSSRFALLDEDAVRVWEIPG